MIEQYGVVGHPVGHSRSPFIHGLFARQTGQAMDYRLYDVPPEEFVVRVTGFFAGGGRGLNITVPHKPAAAAFAQVLTPRAERAQAVNTLAALADDTILGDNTDGAGFVTDLTQNLGLELEGRRILLLGAGGATRGVVGPLLGREPTEIVVANRNAARAVELARRFDDLGPVRGCAFGELSGAPYDLVVNATSTSLRGERPDVPASVLGPDTFCYDMAYGREDTPFLRWAKAEGCAGATLGWGMLVEQAAESFELWRGVRPQTRPVLEALQSMR
jgi:shikimate dehydrogenase